jgi:hypothetical protein
MIRVYENLSGLSRLIIRRRIRMLDPLAVLEFYERDETEGKCWLRLARKA